MQPLTLFLATRNRHKVSELQSLLGDTVRCLDLSHAPGAPDAVEDANTFAGNAMKKSLTLARWLATQSPEQIPALKEPNLAVLADDSGLEVDALNGAPGVHSARFAALDSGQPGNSKDADNNAKLLGLLANVPAEKRTARFRCVLALSPIIRTETHTASPVCAADEAEVQTEVFDGACEGHIILTPSGAGGFGYDPLFVPAGYEKSFAELGEEIKNTISHRANALTKLRARLVKRTV